MQRVVDMFPKFRNQYERYLKLVVQAHHLVNNHSELDELKQLEITSILEDIRDDREVMSESVLTLLNNLTIPLEYDNSQNVQCGKTRATKLPSTNMKINGVLGNSSKYVNMLLQDIEIQPMESLVGFKSSTLMKCFTYFSALSHDWRNFKMNLDSIVTDIRHRDEWFPSTFFNRYFLSIDSPNSLPEMSE